MRCRIIATKIVPGIIAGAVLAYSVSAANMPADYAAQPAAIVVHFGQIPPLELPCDDLQLYYNPRFADYLSQADLLAANAARQQILKLDKEIKTGRDVIGDKTQELLFEGYDYHRKAMDSKTPEEFQSAVVAFINLQYDWYVALSRLTKLEQERVTHAKTYLDKTAPVFRMVATAGERTKLLDDLFARLSCLHEARAEAFQKAIKGETKLAELATRIFGDMAAQGLPLAQQIEGLGAKKDDVFKVASQMGLVIAQHARYSMLASEESSELEHFRSLANAHAASMESIKLHPLLMEQHRQAGVTLGPEDPFPPDRAARRVRAEISNQRARIALAYLYLQDVQNELGYFKQLNIMSGVYGWSGFKEQGSKFFTDVAATRDVVTGKSVAMDFSTAVLSLLAAASEFVGGSFGTLVSGPVQDIFITTLKRPAEFAGYDLKTSAESAFDQYLQAHATASESIKFIETIIERHSGDPDAAALHAQQLIAEVASDHAGRRQQGRVPIGRFLDDDAFIGGSGGGMAFVLEPFAESVAQTTKLHFHAAREELKAAARNGYLRIAIDRGITVDNPDLELSPAMLDSTPTESELGLEKDDYQFAKMVVKAKAYLLSGPGRAEILDTITPGLSQSFFFGAKNYPSQDEWLRTLINNQRQFDSVLQALQQVDYRFAEMAMTNPQALRRHQYLLANCPEYIGAYIKYRGALVERMKMATASNPDRSAAGAGAGLYRTQLAMLDKAQQIELYDLGARQAYLKLQHDALTVNYLAAAGQVIALQNMENQRRVSLGDSSRVDLKESAQMFRREARLAAATVVYQGLLAQAAQDLAMHFSFDAIGRMVVAGPKEKWSFFSAGSATRAQLNKEFREGLNPWSSLFVKDGIYETIKGGAMDASIMALSQAAATGSVFQASDYNSVFSSIKNLGSKYMEKRGEFSAQVESHYNAQQAADRKIILDRLERLTAIETTIQKPLQDDLNKLANLNDAADRGDTDSVKRLQAELLNAAKNAALNSERAHYKLLMEGLQDVVERTRILDDEVDSAVTSGPVIETVAAALRNKSNGTSGGDNEALTQLTHLEKIKTIRNLFENGKPTVADIERIANASDPLAVRAELLSNAMDIGLIRRALKLTKESAAASNDTAALKRIENAAKAIDDHRIALVNNTLAEFFDANPDFRNSTVNVMQGGAAAGNPEHQGILGDIDFTVLTAPGYEGGKKLKEALEKYFADKGFPLAVGEAASSMDTETFVQPAGRFDAAGEQVATIIEDLAVKMGDATRFYSEGGGKWFLNNMAYSGKQLWGAGEFVRTWVNVKRGEAHGLAVDMTRYMSFLTDPKYDPQKIRSISDAKLRRDVLTSAMSKTKYYIRLLDAYVMSHPEGNKLYNSRLDQRTESGENASYHWQIFKNVETLLDNGASTVFDQPGDREMVELMAKMKMKGTNPTPWAVLGEGPEAEAKAIRMIERMRELAPVILASTAQTYHDEVQEIVKSGSRAERKEAFSDVHRMASTVRKVLEVDSFGSTAMMVPKAVTNPDGSVRVLSQTEHQTAVAEAMRVYGEQRKKLTLYYEIQEKISKHFKSHSALDEEGRLDEEKSKKFREEIDTFVKERYSPEQIAARAQQIRLVDDIQEKYYAWFKYKFQLGDQLLRAP